MNTPHPPGPIEWWMGDSRGRWDGETLVVDAVYFTDQTWLDRAGNYHSEDLHVVERYTLPDADHINYEATIEDPKVFALPPLAVAAKASMGTAGEELTIVGKWNNAAVNGSAQSNYTLEYGFPEEHATAMKVPSTNRSHHRSAGRQDSFPAVGDEAQ